MVSVHSFVNDLSIYICVSQIKYLIDPTWELKKWV